MPATPFYGPLNAVIHPEVIQQWLDAILSFKPAHESERVAWAFCLAQLARRSGQRALDIDDAQRERVAAVLRSLSVQDHWTRMVEEVLEVQSEEQAQTFRRISPYRALDDLRRSPRCPLDGNTSCRSTVRLTDSVSKTNTQRRETVAQVGDIFA